MIILNITAQIFLFTLFAFAHTILASNKTKKRIAHQIGNQIAFYRLFYNVISFLMFYVVLVIAPRPDIIVYDLQYPYDFVMVGIQALALLGLLWSVKGVDIKEFLGISQIKRYLKGIYDVKDLDAKTLLRITGASKYMRHPLYFFIIIFLGCRSIMNLFGFVMFICIVIYFYVGSYYEEKKLVELYGEEYKKYQANVPRIIPLGFIKKLRRTI